MIAACASGLSARRSPRSLRCYAGMEGALLRGMTFRRWRPYVRIAATASLLTSAFVGCAGDVAAEDPDAVDEAELGSGAWPWDPHPSCNAQGPAEKALKRAGFVRTAVVPLPLAVGGSAQSGYTYRNAPAFRYEHPDGRVQYAHCYGRVGPRFPVENRVADVTGTWTGTATTPWGTVRKLGPVPGKVHLVLRDFELLPIRAVIATDVDMSTPLTHASRHSAPIAVGIEETDALVDYDTNQRSISMASKAATGEPMSLDVTFDIRGNITSAKAEATGSWESWRFATP